MVNDTTPFPRCESNATDDKRCDAPVTQALNLELNACMGGMSEGFRRAGVRFDMAVDYDRNACDSYERNIGLRPIQIDIRDLLRMARLGAFQPSVRLLVGDPPCTPWSMAGEHKGLEDERDLLRETVELIDILRPTAWLIGNVPGLDKAENWSKVVLPVICEPARRAGYCVDYVSLSAADFGTPQNRVRPFWFGHQSGSPCIRWEQPTHARSPALPGLGLRPWVSCGEALEAVFGPRASWGSEVGRSVRLRRRGQNARDGLSRLAKPARTVGTSNLSDGNRQSAVLTYDIHHPPSRIDEPGFVVRAGNGGGANRAMAIDGDALVTRRLPDPNRPMADPHEPHRTVSQVRDQALLAGDMRDAGLFDRPETTIGERDELTATGHHDPNVSGGGNSGILLSEQALLVIQGFPREWHVAGKTKTARMSQIGQANPPQLSLALAMSIRKWAEKNGVDIGVQPLPQEEGERTVYEHRWAMEQHLGRPLHRDELVHHKNGDRFDNRSDAPLFAEVARS